MTDQTPSPAPVVVAYDLTARLLGQKYLLCAHEDGPGFATVPVAD